MSDNTRRNGNRNWNPDRDYDEYDSENKGRGQDRDNRQQGGVRNYDRNNPPYSQSGIENWQRNSGNNDRSGRYDRDTDYYRQNSTQGDYRNRDTSGQGYSQYNRDRDYDRESYSQSDYSRGERRQNQRYPETDYPETSERPYRTDMPRRDVGQYVEPDSSWSSDQGRTQYGNSYGNNSNWQRQGQHTGRGPQGWQRSDDRITEDVNERLTQHGDIDATNIQVRVSKGEVTLDGTVDSRWTKRTVEDTVEGISGVKHIQNNLRVSDSSMAQGSNSTSNQRSGSSTNGGNGGSTQNQQSGQQSDLGKSRQSTKTANPN